MEEEISISKLDNSRGYIITDNMELFNELYDALSFWVPNYRFMASYIDGRFDGKIKLIDYATRTYPLGLSKYICDYCESKKIKCSVDNEIIESFRDKVSVDEIHNFVNSIKLYSKGNVITPRQDQMYAVTRAITSKRCVNICPTSFGKSLAITLECLWYISKVKRCLIVVPTKDLVDQFYNDITDYATNPEGNKEHWYPYMQKIYGGKERVLEEDTDICISTWQSLNLAEKGFLNQFDVIILDECHTGHAKIIQQLMMTTKDVEIKTGWTGTLSNETIGELQVQGIFGPAEEIITTKELMDKGIVAQLSIIISRLTYNDEECKLVNNFDFYKQEKYIETHIPRNKLLMTIVGTQSKTGLILYKHIKHGEMLYKMAKKMYPDRNVYLIHSGCYMMNDKKYKTMEDIKQFVENDTSGIIIAIYKVVGTGISIKNLHWMMFSVPFKSFITTIQGIGRILRVSKAKHKALLIDVVDDFCYKEKKKVISNYAVKHFYERFNIYNESKFDYKITKFSINSEIEHKTKNKIDNFVE